MLTTSAAIVGLWKDQSTREYIVSVKDPWGIVIVAIAGIWLSWCTKYIKKIIGNFALWKHIPGDNKTQTTDADEAATESTAFLGSRSNKGQSLAKVLKKRSAIRDLLAELFFGENLEKGDKARLAAFVFGVAVVVSATIVGAWFAAKVSVDGPALLASGRCGLWLYDGDSRSEAATRNRLLDLEKEERAAQFAEDCYRLNDTVASICKVLYRPTLPLEDAKYTNVCPFHNDICRINQTVTFTTPFIDAKDLGFNFPSSPKFRRNTSCTALSMNYPFVQNSTVNGTTTFTYHYGSRNDGDQNIDYTYKTVGNPWDRDAPVYDMFAYTSTNGSDDPVWTPHSNLTHDSYSTVTIIFISSLRILYEKGSNDPIFPADKHWSLPGDDKYWYRNSDARARPLACVETIEVCAPDRKSCRNINDDSGPDDTVELVLLEASLYKTDLYYSFAKRQGRSLLAQKKVSQYFSVGLEDNAWVDEVKNWVQTSLSRTSMNAWSVASGEDFVHGGRDGFTEVTKPYGNLCGYYKYNPRGYQSLRFWPLIVMVGALPALWILSWDYTFDRRYCKEGFDFTVHWLQSAAKGERSPPTEARSQEEQRAGGGSSDPIPSNANVSYGGTTSQQGATGGPVVSEGESSTAAVIQQSQQQDNDAESIRITEEDTESTRVIWEPLVLHEFFYALALLIVGILTGILFVLWVFPKYVWKACITSDSTNQ
ncbi:hypothetical protein EK21DRAFT_114027 [Setomelanomma holmii]|uniref:Uncharacterized protein n=1 Tax=Setomelanomma holmii TaxID=210430 RepID=A0A9P4H4W7_9PLEO|nr:hypothetical protein EK21DRAFT_114027 [Setomelanomma holmii]